MMSQNNRKEGDGVEYEKRIVCYMDVLGFKNLVKGSAGSPEIRDQIHKLLTDMNNLGKLNELVEDYCLAGVSVNNKDISIFTSDGMSGLGVKSEMSFFSDSFIFSYGLTQRRDDLADVYVVLDELTYMVFQMLRTGIFVRGGLAYGNAYHKDNVCFGPAVVKAVELEGDAAFPIIGIDKSFFDKASPDSVFWGNDYGDKYQSFVKDSFYAVDPGHRLKSKELTDFPYLDVLRYQIDNDESIALEAKAVIERELKKKHEQHIAEKYIWLRNHFNKVVDDMGIHKAYIDIGGCK